MGNKQSKTTTINIVEKPPAYEQTTKEEPPIPSAPPLEKYPRPYARVLMINGAFVFAVPVCSKFDRTADYISVLQAEGMPASKIRWISEDKARELAQYYVPWTEKRYSKWRDYAKYLKQRKQQNKYVLENRMLTHEEWDSCPFKEWWYEELLKYQAVLSLVKSQESAILDIGQKYEICNINQKLLDAFGYTQQDLQRRMTELVTEPSLK